MNKEEQLLVLARKRQDSVPVGFNSIGEYHGGAYECDYVSPYSKSAHNVDAEVMFILQDWSSDEFLRKPLVQEVVQLGHTPALPTNKNLKALLKEHFGLLLEQTYGTNLFPFIKPGNISSGIPASALVQAAITYAIPQIEIVSPKVVICLGASVFNSIRRGLDKKPVKGLAEAIARPFAFNGASIWAQSHPGGLGRAGRNKGGVDRVSEDWAAMARSVNA